MSAPLSVEAAELERHGLRLQLVAQPGGWTFLLFRAYPLPAHFNQQTTDLLIKVPPTYPHAGLDMFWVEAGVRLATGALPAGTSHEQVLDEQWLRFSWHPVGWRRQSDTVRTFLAFINQRLQRGD